MKLLELMEYAQDNECSDLHLSTGEPPIVRKSGDLVRLNYPVLKDSDLREFLREIMSPEQLATYEKEWELDFSYTVPNKMRFRVNAFHQTRGVSIALRRLSFIVPSLEQIHLNDATFDRICRYANGLVLVTGATGSGKSTTLAAMINHINTALGASSHILTIEDPVEYLFKSENCLIQQREVGRDTHFFHSALRAALREDPDIIMVGELRDLETIRLALTAAETGHLVFGTLHTSTASSAVDRIIDVFPGPEKPIIREMLAESLRAVVAQRLFKTPQNTMYPANEILISTTAVRNLIREHKIPQLFSVIQTGAQHGMHTFEQHIDKLVTKQLILPVDPREFRGE